MPSNANPSQGAPVDPDFLITEKTPDHSLVERTVTVKSVNLPGTRCAEVEMIEISEKAIPLPSSNGNGKMSNGHGGK
jgi:hypothetical protein